MMRQAGMRPTEGEPLLYEPGRPFKPREYGERIR